MSITPSTPSDGDQDGPVDPLDSPPPESPLPGGAGEPRNRAGLAALVCGVLAMLSVWVFPLGVVVFGIAAVVLGIKGVRRARRGEATNKSQAVGGLVAGLLAIVVFAFLAVSFFVQNREELAEFGDCVEAAATDEERDECRERLEDSIRR